MYTIVEFNYTKYAVPARCRKPRKVGVFQESIKLEIKEVPADKITFFRTMKDPSRPGCAFDVIQYNGKTYRNDMAIGEGCVWYKQTKENYKMYQHTTDYPSSWCHDDVVSFLQMKADNRICVNGFVYKEEHQN